MGNLPSRFFLFFKAIFKIIQVAVTHSVFNDGAYGTIASLMVEPKSQKINSPWFRFNYFRLDSFENVCLYKNTCIAKFSLSKMRELERICKLSESSEAILLKVFIRTFRTVKVLFADEDGTRFCGAKFACFLHSYILWTKSSKERKGWLPIGLVNCRGHFT